MSIDAGTRLGRYEILALLGEGGMGLVYSARDTELGRDVAIKVLPAEFSKDPERLGRFRQEAQALARLNHPNILSILDVGSFDGSFYVVSELLEGQTLRDRLGNKLVTPRRALDYAQQVLHGLATAHDKGIIHRDLKPENLFITKDGHVKILDFGLAKLTTQSQKNEIATEAPTAKMNTAPGMVLGTIAYMSPEQLRGKSDLIDHRTDIFSFGAILYEMLTGKRAFQGESTADTMSAILVNDPPEITISNSTLSTALNRIVSRCLEKRPEERFQSATDIRFALDALSDISRVSRISPALSRSKRKLLPIAGGLFLVAAIIIGGIFLGKTIWTSAPPSYQQLTFRRGTIWSARFTPDSQTVIYSAAWGGDATECFSARLDAREARPLGLPNAEVLAVSSTGEMAVLLNRRHRGFFIGQGTLARMPISGGAPREIMEDVEQADWSPDGKELAVVRYVGSRRQLEYPIGNVLYETEGWISNPRISPSGDRIAFLDHQILEDDRGSVAVIDLARNKKVLSGDWGTEEGLAWAPNGKEVWFTATQSGEAQSLYAVDLSARSRVVARVPANLMLHDISPDGHVLVVRGIATTDQIGLAPGDTRERDLSWLDSVAAFDLSSDGRTYIFQYFGEGSGTNYTSYIRKTDGSPPIRLGEGAALSLASDGKSVVTVFHDPPRIVILPTGPGQAKTLERYDIEQYSWASWFPDEKRVLFTGRQPGQPMRCFVQQVDGGSPPRAITPPGIIGTTVSADGKFVIAADANDQNFLYPVDGGKAQPILGLEHGDKLLRWTGDGKRIYVQAAGMLPIKIFLVEPVTGHREMFKELMPPDPAGLTTRPGILLTPDGKWYIYTLRRNLTTLFLATGLG